MTREEAKKIADLSISTIKRYSDLTKRFNGLIDEIYDDFESRVCENCKYFDFPYPKRIRGLCTKETEDVDELVKKDFGCIHFERREDEANDV